MGEPVEGRGIIERTKDIVRIVLTFVLLGIAVYLYSSLSSEGATVVTIAKTNAATFITANIIAYWFAPRD
jgi:hypothetical protein